MFFDPTYILIVLLPTLILTGLAQMWVRGAYQKWSEIPNASRVNGFDTAQVLMQRAGIQRVGLEVAQGQLTDHFDPSSGIVRLSDGVARQPSIASMAIAAHEFGHVQQHQQNSPLMAVRGMLIPAATLGAARGLSADHPGPDHELHRAGRRGSDPVRRDDALHHRDTACRTGRQPPRDELLQQTGLIANEQDARRFARPCCGRRRLPMSPRSPRRC